MSWQALGWQRRTGAERLSEWLAGRAKHAGKVLAVEEALLTGRFGAYAFRRLAAFFLARGWGAALHVIELTWLAEVFSAKQFVASLALQNGALVLDALAFGALEAMRRRARILGAGTDSSALTSRWLTAAAWLGLFVILVPVARVAMDVEGADRGPTLFHVYALVCGMRLAADVVLRTYYSGVYAFHRVYRALWTPLVGPTVVVGGTVLLYPYAVGWSFPIALLASVVASRGILFVYTRRAYRLRRIPTPHFRLRPRLRERGFHTLRQGILAGLANTTTRIGGVVLLAAVVPSLMTPGTFEDEAPHIEPFAFALHLAAPLLAIAGQWGLVFYHDYKRLEADDAAALARHLHVRVLVTAVLVAVFSWVVGSALIACWVPWRDVATTLAALLPAMVGLSIWTAIQLRGFAHGEFEKQVASAVAMLAVLWVVLSSSFLGNETWYVALAAGPWAAIALQAALAFVRNHHATGEIPTIATWVRALGANRRDVVVWEARAVVRPAEITERIAKELGDRGAIVRTKRNLLWFERAPFTARTAWLRMTGGALARLEGTPARPGTAQRAWLEANGSLGRPATSGRAIEELAAAYVALFPKGFVVRVGGRAPASFRALTPAVRQAIWRDALRSQRGARSQSGWFVTSYCPRGTTEAFFATPRPITADEGARWQAHIAPHGWRIEKHADELWRGEIVDVSSPACESLP